MNAHRSESNEGGGIGGGAGGIDTTCGTGTAAPCGAGGCAGGLEACIAAASAGAAAGACPLPAPAARFPQELPSPEKLRLCECLAPPKPSNDAPDALRERLSPRVPAMLLASIT